MPGLSLPLSDERGSILFIVVIVMLVFGVTGASFVLLANLEGRIGINYKEAMQALTLTEGALEHGRDQARALVGAAVNFSNASLVGNANDGSLLVTDASLGDGTYSVRIDNDCTVAVRSTRPADPGCSTHTDDNQRAVLTAWATRGSGRARVRAWVETSNPWKHVCYNGDGVLCTEEPSANASATVDPSDPDDINGPATGPLPVPIDLVCGASVRRTADVSFGATDCVINPYYDVALDTPCPDCGRVGCKGHTGLPPDGFCPDSGMVFYGCSGLGCTGTALLHGANILIAQSGQGQVFQCAGDHTGGNHPGCPGNANVGVVVYVMGKARLGSQGEVNGTIVVHGDGTGGTSRPALDMGIIGQSGIWSISTCAPNCGFPLVLLVYDPAQSALPQNTFANVSNRNSELHGVVYSAGEVSFSPLTLDGGVVAWKASFQSGASSARYNATYGAVKPPGFSTPAGSQTVTVDRRTWSQCKLYSSTESSAPTSCN